MDAMVTMLPLARAQVRQGGLADQHRSGQVDPEVALPGGEVELLELAELVDPRDVHHDVEAAEPLGRGGDGGLHRALVADVARETSSDGLRSRPTTAAPSAASSSTVARPTPPAAPVTSARLPVNRVPTITSLSRSGPGSRLRHGRGQRGMALISIGPP